MGREQRCICSLLLLFQWFHTIIKGMEEVTYRHKKATKYLMQYRMKKAKELLKNSELHVSKVAYTVGYSDPLAFSKMFKKREGVSPLEYKQK